MATKKELEDRIASLERMCREQRKALDNFGQASGMEITLPAAEHHTAKGDSPYVRDSALQNKLIPLIGKALEKRAVNEKTCGGASCRYDLSLHDEYLCRPGPTFIVPAIWGEVMVDILDAAAEFGRECYAKGHTEGSNLLRRFVANEITVDEFDDSVDRERAIRRQESHDFHYRIRSHDS